MTIIVSPGPLTQRRQWSIIIPPSERFRPQTVILFSCHVSGDAALSHARGKTKDGKVEDHRKESFDKDTQEDNSLHHCFDIVQKSNPHFPGQDDTWMNETSAAVCKNTSHSETAAQLFCIYMTDVRTSSMQQAWILLSVKVCNFPTVWAMSPEQLKLQPDAKGLNQFWFRVSEWWSFYSLVWQGSESLPRFTAGPLTAAKCAGWVQVAQLETFSNLKLCFV